MFFIHTFYLGPWTVTVWYRYEAAPTPLLDTHSCSILQLRSHASAALPKGPSAAIVQTGVPMS